MAAEEAGSELPEEEEEEEEEEAGSEERTSADIDGETGWLAPTVPAVRFGGGVS